MQKTPEYAFDIEGHTVVRKATKEGVLVYYSTQAFNRDQDIAARKDTTIIDDSAKREDGNNDQAGSTAQD